MGSRDGSFVRARPAPATLARNGWFEIEQTVREMQFRLGERALRPECEPVTARQRGSNKRFGTVPRAGGHAAEPPPCGGPPACDANPLRSPRLEDRDRARRPNQREAHIPRLRHTFARIAIEHDRPIFWLSKHSGTRPRRARATCTGISRRRPGDGRPKRWPGCSASHSELESVRQPYLRRALRRQLARRLASLSLAFAFELVYSHVRVAHELIKRRSDQSLIPRSKTDRDAVQESRLIHAEGGTSQPRPGSSRVAGRRRGAMRCSLARGRSHGEQAVGAVNVDLCGIQFTLTLLATDGDRSGAPAGVAPTGEKRTFHSLRHVR